MSRTAPLWRFLRRLLRAFSAGMSHGGYPDSVSGSQQRPYEEP